MSESHPFTPFIPQNAELLMLGTFPPKQERWSMEFYYPNWINDMWRIMGIVFFDDKNRFCDIENRKFKLDEIKTFLSTHHIAMHDTAASVVRTKDNASDKWLEITEPIDLKTYLSLMPRLRAIATTGEKAASVIAGITETEIPKVGHCVECTFCKRSFKHYRMPSTSRAYPMNILEKAKFYASMFEELGFTKQT